MNRGLITLCGIGLLALLCACSSSDTSGAAGGGNAGSGVGGGGGTGGTSGDCTPPSGSTADRCTTYSTALSGFKTGDSSAIPAKFPAAPAGLVLCGSAVVSGVNEVIYMVDTAVMTTTMKYYTDELTKLGYGVKDEPGSCKDTLLVSEADSSIPTINVDFLQTQGLLMIVLM